MRRHPARGFVAEVSPNVRTEETQQVRCQVHKDYEIGCCDHQRHPQCRRPWRHKVLALGFLEVRAALVMHVALVMPAAQRPQSLRQRQG